MIVLPSEVDLSAHKENLYDLLRNRNYLSTFRHDNDIFITKVSELEHL